MRILIFLLLLTFDFTTTWNGVNILFLVLGIIAVFLSGRVDWKYSLGLSCIYIIVGSYYHLRLGTILNAVIFAFLIGGVPFFVRFGINKILRLYIVISCFVVYVQFALFHFTGVKMNHVWSAVENYDYRPNGLSYEPSYASFLIVLALATQTLKFKRRNDLVLVIGVIIALLLMNSSSGYLLFLLMMLGPYLNMKVLPLILFAMIGVMHSIIEVDILTLFDILVSFDHSLSVRLIPLIIFLRDVLSLNWYGFFVINSLYSYKVYILEYLPGVSLEYWSGGGFIPSFVYTYGIYGLFFFKRALLGLNIDAFLVGSLILAGINFPLNSQAFFLTLLFLHERNYRVTTC